MKKKLLKGDYEKMKKKIILFVICAIFMVAFCGKPWKVQAADKTNYTIYVNRRTNIVNVVNRKNKKLVRSMYCSTGKNYGTIKGTFKTKERLRWHALYGGVYGQYCTRISGAYLFHSVPYFTTKCSAVETVEYNKLATRASLGCVRLAVTDCKWIYDHCKIGTQVVIGEKKNLKKPTRPLLKISTKKKSGWDPTDPNRANPYYPKMNLKSNALLTVKKDSKFNAKSVINVYSDFVKPEILINYVKVTGTVNTAKVGNYKVVYSLTDPATLLKKKLTVTFKVVQ